MWPLPIPYAAMPVLSWPNVSQPLTVLLPDLQDDVMVGTNAFISLHNLSFFNTLMPATWFEWLMKLNQMGSSLFFSLCVPSSWDLSNLISRCSNRGVHLWQAGQEASLQDDQHRAAGPVHVGSRQWIWSGDTIRSVGRMRPLTETVVSLSLLYV